MGGDPIVVVLTGICFPMRTAGLRADNAFRFAGEAAIDLDRALEFSAGSWA